MRNKLKLIREHEKEQAKKKFADYVSWTNDASEVEDKSDNNFAAALETFLIRESETRILALILYFEQDKNCVYERKAKFWDCIDAILKKHAPTSTFLFTQKCHDFVIRDSGGKRRAVKTR